MALIGSVSNKTSHFQNRSVIFPLLSRINPNPRTFLPFHSAQVLLQENSSVPFPSMETGKRKNQKFCLAAEFTILMSTSDCSIYCQFEDAESKMNLDGIISPDDVAWADSCLTFEPEINMDSLKEALLEFVSYHSEPLETSKDKRQASNDEITPSTEEMDISTNFEVHVESVPFTNTTENMDEDDPLKEETDAPTSTDYLAKAFLPNFKDEMIEIQYFPDSDADLDFPEFAWESLYEEIFKVWDLSLPVEEDLRMGRLSKTLGDESLKKVVSIFVGSEAGEGINDLIAGIADMSLQRRFGRKYHVRK